MKKGLQRFIQLALLLLVFQIPTIKVWAQSNPTTTGPIGTQLAYSVNENIKYWNGTVWIAIPSGLPGQSLTFPNGVPTWVNNPNGITTNVVTNFTGTTAICGGDIASSSGSPITARGVCWSTNHNPTLTNNHTSDDIGKGNFTSTLTGLTADTTYYLRAYATNSAGIAYGNEVIFTKAPLINIFWYSNMSSSNGWTVTNATNATLTTKWQWIQDTIHTSTYYNQYVHPTTFMLSPTANQGVFYFDGITNLINSNYGISNSMLTNTTAINTLGHSNVTLKFYQLYKAFNSDSTLMEISSDNINWHSIEVNSTLQANQTANGFQEFNISQWTANKPQVWFRFRYYAPAIFNSQVQYSGGYGWMIDDVSLVDIQ